MPRCFVGYLLPKGLKNNIETIQKEIATWPLKCKFVERDNLHLNFSFLGEISENEINNIKLKLDTIAVESKKFKVLIGELRAIPDKNYIRVLVLDVTCYDENMKNLFAKILERVGGDSKPVHLTLCRVKSISDKFLVRKKIETLEKKQQGEFVINSIQLIKSELGPSGPVYSVIHESNLID